PALLRIACRCESTIAVDDAKGVDLGLQFIETIEEEPRYFGRGQRFLAVKAKQRGCRCVSDVLAGAHCSPSFSTHSKTNLWRGFCAVNPDHVRSATRYRGSNRGTDEFFRTHVSNGDCRDRARPVSGSEHGARRDWGKDPALHPAGRF